MDCKKIIDNNIFLIIAVLILVSFSCNQTPLLDETNYQTSDSETTSKTPIKDRNISIPTQVITATTVIDTYPTETLVSTSVISTKTPKEKPIAFYFCDFESICPEWPEDQSLMPYVNYKYFRGMYGIIHSDTGFNTPEIVIKTLGSTISNGVFSIDIWHIQGNDEGSAAVLLWNYIQNEKSQLSTYYMITIYGNGEASIGYSNPQVERVGDEFHGYSDVLLPYRETIFPRQKIPSLKLKMNVDNFSKDQANHVDITYSSGKLEVFINGELIHTQNAQELPVGQVGIGVLNQIDINTQPAEIYFDNLAIYEYDSWYSNR